jgi:hypothetical protein
MNDMTLNIFSDFILVLNSIKKYSTKRGHFPMHIVFSTIYLLQKEILNHRNYFEQEINMTNFVQATENYLHMYARFECLDVYEFL